MGNRANVVLKQDNGTYIGLHLHWASEDHEKDVARAINRGIEAGRTDDIGYANRILISELIGEDWKQDLGYGIKAGQSIESTIDDNNNDIIVIHWENEMVYIWAFDRTNWELSGVTDTYTFQEFIDSYL